MTAQIHGRILVQPIAAAAVDRSIFSGFCAEPTAGNAEICRAAGAQNLLPVFFEHGRIENYRIEDQTLGLFAVFINRQVERQRDMVAFPFAFACTQPVVGCKLRLKPFAGAAGSRL